MTRLRAEAAPTVVAVDSLIDEVLLRTLEPAVTALNRLFDAARPEASAHGEPDGFDGLDRVGPPERLLATEWLLASEAPDEFLRRYDQGELGYLRVHRAQEQRSPTALVLFDTGPEQLGLPRVAQLACLVVLSRRAARAGVELRWGTLHQTQRWSTDDPHVLERFVQARTLRVVRDLPVDAFVDDCLVVAPRVGEPYPAQQLVLSDAGDAVRADVIDRRTGTTRHAVLPMPAPDDAVRLLRNPANSRAAPLNKTGAGPPISNLVFDQEGNKVLARIAPNRIALYPAPPSATAQPGRIRYVTTAESYGVVAAAGRVGKSVLTASVVGEGNEVVIDRFGGSVTAPVGRFPIEGGPLPVPTLDSALGALEWNGSKLRVRLADHLLTPTVDGYRVSAADQSLRWGDAGFDVRAEQAKDGAWVVRYGSMEWRHRGEPVLSPILRWGGSRRDARVLVVSADGMSVLARGARGAVDTLYNAGELIVDVVVHRRRERYAVRTQSGRVVVRNWGPDETAYEALP